MKTRVIKLTLLPVLVSVMSFTAQAATLFSDDFNDNLDDGWTHLSQFALSTGQTWDASSGRYRLTAPPNGYNPGNGTYGFVGSAVNGVTLSDGYVQADVVAFLGGGPTQSAYGAFAIGARLNNLTSPLGMTGYAVAYEPYGNSGGPTLRLQRLGPPSIFNNLGAVNVNLTPGGQYTMTLETVGSSIVGSIWNLGQAGSSLVARVSATDATYASGSIGLLGVAQAPMPTADTTWDNFVAVVPEPGTGALLALGIASLLLRRSGTKH